MSTNHDDIDVKRCTKTPLSETHHKCGSLGRRRDRSRSPGRKPNRRPKNVQKLNKFKHKPGRKHRNIHRTARGGSKSVTRHSPTEKWRLVRYRDKAVHDALGTSHFFDYHKSSDPPVHSDGAGLKLKVVRCPEVRIDPSDGLAKVGEFVEFMVTIYFVFLQGPVSIGIGCKRGSSDMICVILK